jgi:hypothetical protein
MAFNIKPKDKYPFHCHIKVKGAVHDQLYIKAQWLTHCDLPTKFISVFCTFHTINRDFCNNQYSSVLIYNGETLYLLRRGN